MSVHVQSFSFVWGTQQANLTETLLFLNVAACLILFALFSFKITSSAVLL